VRLFSGIVLFSIEIVRLFSGIGLLSIEIERLSGKLFQLVGCWRRSMLTSPARRGASAPF
jgi:hypothetical protein